MSSKICNLNSLESERTPKHLFYIRCFGVLGIKDDSLLAWNIKELPSKQRSFMNQKEAFKWKKVWERQRWGCYLYVEAWCCFGYGEDYQGREGGTAEPLHYTACPAVSFCWDLSCYHKNTHKQSNILNMHTPQQAQCKREERKKTEIDRRQRVRERRREKGHKQAVSNYHAFSNSKNDINLNLSCGWFHTHPSVNN